MVLTDTAAAILVVLVFGVIPAAWTAWTRRRVGP